MNTGVVLDAGAFIALENHDRYVTALLDRTKETLRPLIASAGVVGQVWRGRATQAIVAKVLKWPNISIADLTHADGRLIGKMLAVSGTSDVIDAHVVLLARSRRCPVVTSDPADLRVLDPTLELWAI